MTPLETKRDLDPSGDGPGKKFPEGFALGAAALFGAVIVLAGLLLLGEFISGPESETLAIDQPAGGGVAGIEESPAQRDPASGASGFGDLPRNTAPPADGGADDEEDSAGEDAGEGGGETGSPAESDVEPLACPSGVDRVICEAAEFVQIARGRPFKTFPEVEILEDAEFDAALLADFEDYRESLEVDDLTLTALGLLDSDLSLAEVFRDSLEVGVVGFYNTDTERLVVRGSDFNLYSQLVLVHELVHAFDDQWIDLGREDFIDDDAEYGFAAVVEGNASRVENQWRDRLTSAELLQLGQQEQAALSPEDMQRLLALPPVVLRLQLSPYTDGRTYVEQLDAVDGEAGVDEALTNPPLTSEDVLHPGNDRSTDIEVVVPAPPSEGEIIDEGRLGELLIRQWLGRRAGAGWGGDRYTTWRSNGDDCIAVDVIGDTDADTAELLSSAEGWAGSQPDQRSTETVTIDGREGVRVTGCG